jgi:hypothetical protein
MPSTYPGEIVEVGSPLCHLVLERFPAISRIPLFFDKNRSFPNPKLLRVYSLQDYARRYVTARIELLVIGAGHALPILS